MRSGWPSTGRLDALISSTRRLNTRHEWFIRILVALVALNVVLELRPLWSSSAPGTRPCSCTPHRPYPRGNPGGGYTLLRRRMRGWLSDIPSSVEWHDRYTYLTDPPECMQLASMVELISSTLPDGSDPRPTHLHAIAAALRENVTAEVGPLLTNRTCRHTDLCAQLFRIPKVAIMFLTKGEMPHEELWRMWFASAEGRLPYQQAADGVCAANSVAVADALLDTMRQVCAPEAQGALSPILRQHLFSVYVHAPPSFPGYSNTSIFNGHLLAQRTTTRWGSFELVLAAKLLLRQALLEPSNHFFVLLSESDVPLYPPSLIYQQIMHEQLSRIDACGNEDTNTRRYRDVLDRDGVSFVHWRKSWQWFMLTRSHARLVVEDKGVHQAFEKHCNPSEEDTSKDGGFDCYSDEHYIPTLLSVLGRENETSCQRTITNVDWRAQGAHPRTYKAHEINPLRIRLLRRPHKRCSYTAAMRSATQTLFPVANITAEASERWPGLCTEARPSYTNVLGSQCPLFARKFPADTHDNLMNIFRDCGSKLHILTENWCPI